MRNCDIDAPSCLRTKTGCILPCGLTGTCFLSGGSVQTVAGLFRLKDLRTVRAMYISRRKAVLTGSLL